MVYLVPQDRTPRGEYIAAIKAAILNFQEWLRGQMGNGKTFRLTPDIVEVHQTAHPASYYPGNGTEPFGFFNRTEADGFALTGGQINDPANIWIFYIDAQNACGQIGGAGGNGRAVMGEDDLKGLAFATPYDRCGEFFNFPVGRWIGGLGHELGHALGLPHPPGCDQGQPSCVRTTLMWQGYSSYPNTFLLPADKTALDASPFLRADWDRLDTDGDQMPDEWEITYGLDPASAADAGGDPDGDASTNAQEFAAGTHPNGRYTRYLAEGATGSFFRTSIALVNPEETAAVVLLRFANDNGTKAAQVIHVPPRARRTAAVHEITGMASASFSTVVESDRPVVVDRTMSWDVNSAYGGHAETSLASPSTTWYLAEGATSGPFSLFYLLQNPHPTPVNVAITFLLPFGQPPVAKSYDLPPNSRTTLAVDDIPELGGTDVSGVITSAAPIVVERAMYLNRPGEAFSAAHASAGVTAPSSQWFLAEGATGPFFDLFILLANPDTRTAEVVVSYLTADGRVLEKPYTLAPQSRTTIWVDVEEFPGIGRALANAAVSTTVAVTNDVPIIVERAMWWPDGGWYESHNSAGSTTTGTRWALADGEVGGGRGVETYILLANTSTFAGDVKVTLLFEDGNTANRTFPVAARSRFNVQVGLEFPQANNRRFGAVIESLGAAPIQLVTERAMYWNANGVVWAAGTNLVGTRLDPVTGAAAPFE